MVSADVLLLLHHDLMRRAIGRFVQGLSYNPYIPTLAVPYTDVLSRLEEGIQLAPTHILMDLNYGHPGACDIMPGREFFAYASREQIPFLGISGNLEVIAQAQSEKIPALLTNGADWLDRLRTFFGENA